jgi:RNA polymerase sigma-70 factor (ECF subfamily)
MYGPVPDSTGSEQHNTDVRLSSPVEHHARANDSTTFLPSRGPLQAGHEQTLSQERLAFLITCVRKRDQLAFSMLYEQFEPPIRKYLTHLVGDRESIPDLIQDTFAKVWVGLPKIPDERDIQFRPWLYRIATNVANDYFRQRPKTHLSSLQAGEEQGEDIPGTEIFEERVCELECIKQALQGLSKRSRECILMSYVEGYTQRQIARHLGISEGAVSRYISDGRIQFRQLYRQLVTQKSAHP